MLSRTIPNTHLLPLIQVFPIALLQFISCASAVLGTLLMMLSPLWPTGFGFMVSVITNVGTWLLLAMIAVQIGAYILI